MRIGMSVGLVFFCVFTAFGSYQHINTDSVLAAVRAFAPAKQPEALNAAAIKLSTTHPRESVTLSRSAIRIARAAGNQREEARAYYLLGNGLSMLGANKDALEAFTRSLEIERVLENTRNEANCLNQLGTAYFNLDMYTLALDNYQKSLTLRNALNDSLSIAGALNNIGIVLDEIQQYDQALEFYLKAQGIARRNSDSILIPDLLNNLGVLYHSRGQNALAREFYNQALEIAQRKGDKYALTMQYSNLADLEIELGRLNEARGYLLQAYPLQQQLSDSSGIISSFIRFGILDSKAGRFASAEKYLLSAAIIAERTESRAYLRDAYEELMNLYNKRNIPGKALAAAQNYINIRNKIEEEKDQLYAFNAFENIEIHRLRSENEQLREKGSLQLEIFFGAGISLLIAAVVLFWRFREKKRLSKILMEKNNAIEESNAELRKMNVEISGKREELAALLHELQISKTRYQKLVEHSPMGILFIAPDGRIIEVNKALVEMLGSPSAEATKKINCFDFPNLIRAGISHDLLEAIDRRISLNNERVYLTKWGKNIIMNYRIVPILEDDGALIGVLSVIEDVTQQRKAERAIQHSEQQFHAVWQSAADGMRITDQNGIIISVNPALCELFHMSSEDLVGKLFTEMHLPDAKERQSEMLEKYRDRFEKRRVSVSLKSPIYRPDGTMFHAELSNSFIEHPGGEVYLLSTFRDITTAVETEQRLRRYSEEQRELNQSKDKFFSIVAHDLKSPFHGLLGLTSLLREDYDTLQEADRVEIMVKLDELAHSVYDLVENLLEWSRIQRGSLKFTPGSVRLAEIVTNAFGLLRHLAVKKNVEIFNTIGTEVFVIADAKMLLSIFTNLIANAIKFSHPGGQISIGTKEYNGTIEIFVRDTGLGMSADEVEKLFRTDAAFSKPGTANERGTGLGLLIVKEMIDMHRGTVAVKSKPGEGSTFTFTLHARQ